MDHHIEQMHEYQEIKDCIDKYCQLTEQIRNPSRDGMIKALVEAQTIAYSEIKNVEYSQGDTIPIPWQYFSDSDLYRKLTQYQKGIYQHCVNKFGEQDFKQFLDAMHQP